LAGYKLHKLADVLSAESEEELYFGLISLWKHPENLVLSASGGPPAWSSGREEIGLADFAARMMYYDLICYLPDDILAKVDRASMAVALEARVPLLDHRLVEFAWRLPSRMKLRD
jgi:asparagine synthase (glutamine-hydrolysing)